MQVGSSQSLPPPAPHREPTIRQEHSAALWPLLEGARRADGGVTGGWRRRGFLTYLSSPSGWLLPEHPPREGKLGPPPLNICWTPHILSPGPQQDPERPRGRGQVADADTTESPSTPSRQTHTAPQRRGPNTTSLIASHQPALMPTPGAKPPARPLRASSP